MHQKQQLKFEFKLSSTLAISAVMYLYLFFQALCFNSSCKYVSIHTSAFLEYSTANIRKQ